jgi:hypothetical protein
MRVKFWLALAAAALAAAVIVPATTASATTAQHPYFMIWKPGTALPKVKAGYKLAAWPSQAALKNLKVGGSFSLTPVPDSSLSTVARALTRNENSAGLVNLEAVPAIGCSPVEFDKDLGPTLVDLEQSYSTYKYVVQSFTYGKNQSSSLEIGISDSGSAGTFSADGTTSVSTTSKQNFPNQRGVSRNYWRSQFEKGLYDQECGDGQWFYYAKIYVWNGGDYFVHPKGTPSTTHCVQELGGGSWNEYKTNATSFKKGFDFSDLDFTGSSQTGYSTTAEITFAFSRTGILCGRTGKPGAVPGFMNAAK